MRLEGRVAVVTGAGRGIGRATSVALAREGADVALAARSADQLEVVAEEVRALGRRAIAVETDVTREADCKRLMERTTAELGGLHILINNAGAVIRDRLVETSTEDWQYVQDVNMLGTFLCSRYAVPVMVANGWGRMIVVSSGAGKTGVPERTAYCAAKFAQIGFAWALDEEVKHLGVRAHIVCPGPTDTYMRNQGFPDEDRSTLSRPEDMADAIIYLLTLPPTSYVRELSVRPGNVAAAKS